MAEIIKESRRVIVTEKQREFDLINCPGSGYTFPVDEHDDVVFKNPEAKENYRYCLEHLEQFVDKGITTNKYSYLEPAVLKCDCGAEIYLSHNSMSAHQCDCGKWYNLFGQELLPPECWKEEY